MFAYLGIAALVGLFITYAVYAYRKHQARLASLVQLCAARGWQFSPTDPWGLPRRWDGHPFDSGYDRTAEHVIAGEYEGHPLIAFDYSYKQDSTDSKGNRTTSTYRFAVVALGMPCALPALHVRPEGVLSRIGQVIGFEDIELESEDFNRRFRVRCPDKKFAMDVLSPRTMEHLLASGKSEFRFAGSDVLAFDSGCLDPVEILRAAHVMAGVIAGVPTFVWRDYGLQERPVTPSPGNLT
jgi:Protein of unknown function (DUF3137)